MLPNFIIIGAAKSGTTALYHYIKQHPDIFMSPLKEAEFFAFEGETLDFNGPGDLPRATITNIKDYLNLFSGQTNETAIGEASPVYLYNSKAPYRIKEYIPQVKIICLLRDPIERAYSQYVMFIRDRREPLKNFLQAIQEEEKRIQNNWAWGWHYTKTSLYYTQLKRYFEVFDPDQIKVYLYEDFKQNTVKVTQNIFDFIGVDNNFTPDIAYRHNISGIPKNSYLDRLLTKKNFAKEVVKPFFSEHFRKNIVRNIRDKNLAKPSLDDEVRQALLSLFYDDILKLQDLLERDLSNWLV